MQTPFDKYDRKYELTTPRTFTKTIHKVTTPNTWRIPKMDGPGPGSYDYVKAY